MWTTIFKKFKVIGFIVTYLTRVRRPPRTMKHGWISSVGKKSGFFPGWGKDMRMSSNGFEQGGRSGFGRTYD